jgi:hypothetical protein
VPLCIRCERQVAEKRRDEEEEEEGKREREAGRLSEGSADLLRAPSETLPRCRRSAAGDRRCRSREERSTSLQVLASGEQEEQRNSAFRRSLASRRRQRARSSSASSVGGSTPIKQLSGTALVLPRASRWLAASRQGHTGPGRSPKSQHVQQVTASTEYTSLLLNPRTTDSRVSRTIRAYRRGRARVSFGARSSTALEETKARTHALSKPQSRFSLPGSRRHSSWMSLSNSGKMVIVRSG